MELGEKRKDGNWGKTKEKKRNQNEELNKPSIKSKLYFKEVDGSDPWALAFSEEEEKLKMEME